MAAVSSARRSELGDALRACRSAFIGVGIMSCMINLLYLTGSIFMLEVYDRVLPSRSVPTLVGLVILAAGPYPPPRGPPLICRRLFRRACTAPHRNPHTPAFPTPLPVPPLVGATPS